MPARARRIRTYVLMVGDLQAVAEKIVMDPAYHDVLSLVKGVRNGIIYGCRVRFPHALV